MKNIHFTHTVWELSGYFIFVMMLTYISVTMSGCSALSNMPTETKMVVTYQTMGATLNHAKAAVLALCGNTTIPDTTCMEAKKAYNQAVTIYKTLGDAAEIAIITGDDTMVIKLSFQLQALISVVNKFLVTQ